MSELSYILIGSGIFYLAILFFIAHMADKKIIPDRWINNPWVYALSLGVYATSWSFYGSVGFAKNNGLLFIAIYIGVTLAFLISPILLAPILKLTKEYQLSSLADLFSFRYRSQLAGVIVTLFMLIGTLPYIALQIKAITDSIQILTDKIPSDVIALSYCLLIIFFSILFGAKHISIREKHHGLVAAIAFESLIKLIAILILSWFAIDLAFGDLESLELWLQDNPEILNKFYQPISQGSWTTFLFLAFAAAFLLPRQFHMIFTENIDAKHLKQASWLFPLFLLLFNIAIPILLFSGTALNLQIPADYYSLGIALKSEHSWLPIITFIGGLSAASAMIVITTLALSSMCLNHLVLPIKKPAPNIDLYAQLLWGRRILIILIIFSGYLFFSVLKQNQGLVQLGLISFVAVAQFIPGIIGLLYWRQATRDGFIVGLIAGILIWFFTLILPLLASSNLVDINPTLLNIHLNIGIDKWVFSTLTSLFVNLSLMVIISLYTKQSSAEIEAANACCQPNKPPISGTVSATSINQFQIDLAVSLGSKTANKEIEQALVDLNMETSETRPAELKKLRIQLEQNLSGLIGPQLAYVIINQRLQLDTEAKTALADSIRYVEEKITSSNTQLLGLSAEINELGKMHRQILQSLPLAVCVIDEELNILIWNDILVNITKIEQKAALHLNIDKLPNTWADLLKKIIKSDVNHLSNIEIESDGKHAVFNLHKSIYMQPLQAVSRKESFGKVLLLEDISQTKSLEKELAHSNRLASIGRLAAGVAHEIGNPITGISCIIQNLQVENENSTDTQNYQDILDQCNRVNHILKSLTNFSRKGSSLADKEKFNLSKTIESAINLASLTYKQRQIKFNYKPVLDNNCLGDQQAIIQAILNILSNAADASEETANINIYLKNNKIIIEDFGEGIDTKSVELVFDPFYTTKAPGKGTGLGLAITYKIIHDHGGSIKLKSQPQHGTTVTIQLPIYES